MIADAPGVATLIGSLDGCLRQTVAELGGPDQLAPGDVLLNNHPFMTGGHPADAALMQRIFHEGALVGFATLRAHIGDLGAKSFYPVDSTEMFQEGTIFPAGKLYAAGELDTTVIKVIEANWRLPRETVGDVFAGVGALEGGVLRTFVDRRIGGLLSADRARSTELLLTLDAYLLSGRSARRAARRLHVHTVYYQLDGVRSVLGDALDDPRRTLDLQVALLAHRLLRRRLDGPDNDRSAPS